MYDRHRAAATTLWNLTLLTQLGGTGAGRGAPARRRTGNEASRSTPRRSNAPVTGALYATSGQPDLWSPSCTQRGRPQRSVGLRDEPVQYNGGVVRQRARTVVEWAERMHEVAPPTEDDVTVLLDGRRLDSRESVEAWLKEVDAIRVRDAVTHDIAV